MNRQFETGSQRDSSEGKPRMSLVPTNELLRVAQHFTKGGEKYGEHNWAKGQPVSVLYDSAQRHLMKLWSSEPDEDHGAAVVWNVIAMMYMIKNKPEMDDRNNFK